MVFSCVFRQLLELQTSKIEHWKSPRWMFGVHQCSSKFHLEMLPKQVCVVLLNTLAFPCDSPLHSRIAEAKTDSIDLVVLELQVVHKDQSMAHFPAKNCTQIFQILASGTVKTEIFGSCVIQAKRSAPSQPPGPWPPPNEPGRKPPRSYIHRAMTNNQWCIWKGKSKWATNPCFL